MVDIQTGAKISEHDKTLRDAITAAVQQMRLRQWCVEQAVKISNSDVQNTEKMINLFHNFVTQQGESDAERT